MTFVVTKPQEDLAPIMTQIGSSSSGSGGSNKLRTIHHPGATLSVVPSLLLRSPSKRRRKKKPSRICCLSISALLFVTFLVAFPYLFSVFESSLVHFQSTESKQKFPNNNDMDDAMDDTTTYDRQAPKLVLGKENNIRAPPPLILGTVDGISYYHQPAVSPTEENHHLVLLHGAAFTKENWKSSGILGLFAKDFPQLAVTALDLPVSADHERLASLLRSMRDEDLVEQLPVSGLVTPSASGKSITSWIRHEASEGLSSFVGLWIPVASYSVASCSASDLETLGKQAPDLKVLAIYGDRDKKGKTVTQSLRDHAGAETLELPGKHPVYLDSPDPFVAAVGRAVLAVG